MDQLKELYIQNFKIMNFITISESQRLKILDWRNNSETRNWMYNEKIISITEHNEFINKLNNDKKNLYYLVDEIGVIYLNKIDLNNKNAYLGIYKNPNTKEKGGILINCLSYIAFNLLNIHTLKLEVLENNIVAVNFYEKFGFIREGILKEFIFRDNKWINVLVMGIINENE